MRFEAFSCIYLLGLLPLLLALYATASGAGAGRWRRSSSGRSPDACCREINGTRRWLKALCLVAAAMCLVIA